MYTKTFIHLTQPNNNSDNYKISWSFKSVSKIITIVCCAWYCINLHCLHWLNAKLPLAVTSAPVVPSTTAATDHVYGCVATSSCSSQLLRVISALSVTELNTIGVVKSKTVVTNILYDIGIDELEITGGDQLNVTDSPFTEEISDGWLSESVLFHFKKYKSVLTLWKVK